jgi:hypothetical protein
MYHKKAFIGLIVFFILSYFVFADAGQSYDLSTAAYDITGGSQVYSVLVDEKHDIVYIGTVDNKFGYYNESSNSTVVLTTIMSAFTTGEYFDMAVDDDRNIVYVTNGQDLTKFGYYNLTSNTSVSLGNLWTYAAKIKYDKDRDVVWYASNDGDFGYVTVDGSKVQKVVHGSGAVADICLDELDERVYVASISFSRAPFYYSIGNESISELPKLQPNIYSCDISYDWHYVYFSAGWDFSYSSIYRPENDEVKIIVYSGDLNPFPDIQYMRTTKTVALSEISIFDPANAGRIYNMTSNTTTFIRDGDIDDWMGVTMMYDGDYMDGSRRYYMGFYDGLFGYYDNNFTEVPFVPLPPPPIETQSVYTDMINNSVYELKDLPVQFNAKFVSWNVSELSLNVYLNGSNETGITANNNSWYAFDISSIMTANTTGEYNLTVFTSYDSITYSFTVIENLIPVSNSSYIAIAILLVCAVFIFAYLGANTENEILKLLFCTTATVATAGLSHSATIIATATSLSPKLITIIRWFTWTFLLISLFVFVYFVYLLIVFMLSLIADMKAGNSVFNKRKGDDDDPFR